MRILMSLFPFVTGPFLNADPGGGGGGGAPTGGGGNPNPSPNPQPQPQPSPQPQPQPGSRVFTEEYVQALRQESAGYRTRAKALEDAARRALGLKDGDNLPDNVADALAALRTAGQQEAAADLNTAKALYAEGLFAAAAAGKVVSPTDAFALVATTGYQIEVDLKSKILVVKDKDGKQLTDKDGKALTGQAAMGALVDKLIEAKPFLKATGAGPSQVGGTAPAGGGGGDPDPKAAAKAIAEERAKARGTTGSTSFWGRKTN